MRQQKRKYEVKKWKEEEKPSRSLAGVVSCLHTESSVEPETWRKREIILISIHEFFYFLLLNQNYTPVLSEAICLLHIIQLHVQLIVQRITTIAAQDTLGTKIHNH